MNINSLMNFETTTKTIPAFVKAWKKISVVGFSSLTDSRLKKAVKANLIISSRPHGNQTSYVKVAGVDVNNARNIHVFQNAPTIKKALAGKANTSSDSARSADADIMATIIAGAAEILFRANGIKAFSTVKKSKKPTSDFRDTLALMYVGTVKDKNGNYRNEFYAHKKLVKLAEKLKDEIAVIKSLKVEAYKAPSTSGNKRVPLYCQADCALNDLMAKYKFQKADAVNIVDMLQCAKHGSLSLNPEPEAVKEAVDHLERTTARQAW
jgi:hypothetical protein